MQNFPFLVTELNCKRTIRLCWVRVAALIAKAHLSRHSDPTDRKFYLISGFSLFTLLVFEKFPATSFAAFAFYVRKERERETTSFALSLSLDSNQLKVKYV